MPLVPDFGETLQHPLGELSPLTQLVFTRDFRIFEQFPHFPEGKKAGIRYLRLSRLPEGLGIIIPNEEEAAEPTRTDELGYEMMMIEAQELVKLLVPKDTSPTNRAIMAYIKELPGDTPIILAWV
jgi:hypothetical protein